jgi:hypothetical protein
MAYVVLYVRGIHNFGRLFYSDDIARVSSSIEELLPDFPGELLYFSFTTNEAKI